MCQSTSESINHLMLHCPFKTHFWNVFLAAFGISWSIPFNIRDAYTSWGGREVRKSIRKIWIMPPNLYLLGYLE